MRNVSGTSGLSALTESTAAEDEEFSVSDLEEPDDDFSSDAESIYAEEDADTSPSAIEASDQRHRARDEQRLMLDLTKHQELLVDSQKMNQSIKRCLGWTEALITEGKKALAYQVPVHDIKVGGKVLHHDEDDGEEEPEAGRGLLSPSHVVAFDTSPWGLDTNDPGADGDVLPFPSSGIREELRRLESFSGHLETATSPPPAPREKDGEARPPEQEQEIVTPYEQNPGMGSSFMSLFGDLTGAGSGNTG